jgi:RNA polymerase sigma-70 factor (ECF subfamily)
VNAAELERCGECARTFEPSTALLAACRGGDREALSELFVLTRPYVYGVALRLARDDAGAADVTQEVYLKLLGRIGQFAGGSSFATWLYRIVVSTALDQRRRLRPWLSFHAEPPLHAPALAAPATQERELLEREAASRLRGEVGRLPLRYRVPLVLRFVAGLSYRQIAETLSISEGTVASRLSRALARLGDDHRPATGEGAK